VWFLEFPKNQKGVITIGWTNEKPYTVTVKISGIYMPHIYKTV